VGSFESEQIHSKFFRLTRYILYREMHNLLCSAVDSKFCSRVVFVDWKSNQRIERSWLPSCFVSLLCICCKNFVFIKVWSNSVSPFFSRFFASFSLDYVVAGSILLIRHVFHQERVISSSFKYSPFHCHFSTCRWGAKNVVTSWEMQPPKVTNLYVGKAKHKHTSKNFPRNHCESLT